MIKYEIQSTLKLTACHDILAVFTQSFRDSNHSSSHANRHKTSNGVQLQTLSVAKDRGFDIAMLQCFYQSLKKNSNAGTPL